MNIVECENVRKSYWQEKLEVQALRGINMNVKKGGFIALAGPSGSGKTTLLNMIGGLDRIDSGRVTLDGKSLAEMEMTGLAEMRLQKVGFIFQTYNLIPVLSALENVELVMLLQGISTEERIDRAREMLNEVGLSDKYNRRPAELSGGQQQRVAVARAIASKPSIVLADEPTANLDSQTGKSLMEMMKALNEQKNVTFIFSTHDEMVMDYASRLIMIRDGQVDKRTGKSHGEVRY